MEGLLDLGVNFSSQVFLAADWATAMQESTAVGNILIDKNLTGLSSGSAWVQKHAFSLEENKSKKEGSNGQQPALRVFCKKTNGRRNNYLLFLLIIYYYALHVCYSFIFITFRK